MYSTVGEVVNPQNETVGRIEDGIVLDRFRGVVGYVQHNNVYRGASPNGERVFALNPIASGQARAIFKLTRRPPSEGPGYNSETIGFIVIGDEFYRIYKYTDFKEGQGKLVGMVHGNCDVFGAAGAACLLLKELS